MNMNIIEEIFPIYPNWEITPKSLYKVEHDKGHKIILTIGDFDILNSKNLKLLNYCKTKAHILIVGVKSDHNINDMTERFSCLKELHIIDYIYIITESNINILLEELTPDYIIMNENINKYNFINKIYTDKIEIYSH